MTYIGRDAESGWNFTIGNVIFSVRMVSPVIDLLDRKKINLHDKGEMDELKCVRACVCVCLQIASVFAVVRTRFASQRKADKPSLGPTKRKF